jgi:hypothetical protein
MYTEMVGTHMLVESGGATEDDVSGAGDSAGDAAGGDDDDDGDGDGDGGDGD